MTASTARDASSRAQSAPGPIGAAADDRVDSLLHLTAEAIEHEPIATFERRPPPEDPDLDGNAIAFAKGPRSRSLVQLEPPVNGHTGAHPGAIAKEAAVANLVVHFELGREIGAGVQVGEIEVPPDDIVGTSVGP